MAVLAAGALLWGLSAGPASADNIRDGQWAIKKYDVANKVWPISQGDGVVVAVIDSGVEADHQDLAGQVLPGMDFSGEQGDGTVDKLGHGTGMASLIAGHGHGDQAGIIGLAPKAKILPVRIAISPSGDINGGQDRLPEALRFAVDHGAKVINMSFGGGADSAVRAAIKYAIDKDVVLVGGAGNLGNHNTPVNYPAAVPGVVAVAAVDQQGNIWEKSNRGPEITLAAPGVGIYSAGNKSESDYRAADGTSDATAYVSAIAALIRSKYPDLSAGQVINRMIKSAVAPPDGSKVPNNSYGYGIASPSKALAPNPAVDGGSKDNPLLGRVESQGGPDGGDGGASQSAAPGDGSGKGSGQQQAAPLKKEDGGGVSMAVYAVIGVVALLVIVGVVLVVRRSGGRGSGGPGAPGGSAGSGGPGGPVGYVPPGGQQQYQPYPQGPQGQQPPQYYQPEPPPPASENPYR